MHLAFFRRSIIRSSHFSIFSYPHSIETAPPDEGEPEETTRSKAEEAKDEATKPEAKHDDPEEFITAPDAEVLNKDKPADPEATPDPAVVITQEKKAEAEITLAAEDVTDPAGPFWTELAPETEVATDAKSDEIDSNDNPSFTMKHGDEISLDTSYAPAGLSD